MGPSVIRAVESDAGRYDSSLNGHIAGSAALDRPAIALSFDLHPGVCAKAIDFVEPAYAMVAVVGAGADPADAAGGSGADLADGAAASAILFRGGADVPSPIGRWSATGEPIDGVLPVAVGRRRAGRLIQQRGRAVCFQLDCRIPSSRRAGFAVAAAHGG